MPDQIEHSALLARLDERTQHIEEDVKRIRQDIVGKFVTKDQFEPVKRVVYGLVGIVLVSFVGALVALVVK